MNLNSQKVLLLGINLKKKVLVLAEMLFLVFKAINYLTKLLLKMKKQIIITIMVIKNLKFKLIQIVLFME